MYTTIYINICVYCVTITIISYVNIMTLLFFILYVYLYTYNSCEFLSCKKWQFIFDYVLRWRYERKQTIAMNHVRAKQLIFL